MDRLMAQVATEFYKVVMKHMIVPDDNEVWRWAVEAAQDAQEVVYGS